MQTIEQKLGMLGQRRVVIEQDVAALRREGADCGVEAENLQAEIVRRNEGGGQGSEDGTNAGGRSLSRHGGEVGQGDGGVDALQNIVGAAQDDHALEALVEHVAGKAGEHLGCGLPGDAVVVQQQRPPVGDGIAHENSGRVELRRKSRRGERHERPGGREDVYVNACGTAERSGHGGECGQQRGSERSHGQHRRRA